MTEYPVIVVADDSGPWPADINNAAAHAYISLGDLYAVDIARLQATGKPVLGVYGNHCRRGYLDNQPNTINLTANRPAALRPWGNATVLGIEGCVRYKDSPTDILYTQEEYAAVLDPITTLIDIIITHCPPAGCNDHTDPAHQGITALTRLIDRCHPRLLIHGHTYPDQPLTQFHGTQIRYIHGWQPTTIDI